MGNERAKLNKKLKILQELRNIQKRQQKEHEEQMLLLKFFKFPVKPEDP